MSIGRTEWPEIGEFVVATISRVEGYGAYVTLDEYDNKEGLLHISEISSRWVRNIRNHVRQGQKVVLQVLRLDSSKGQVDLSLRRVSRDERRKKIESWKKTRKAETLLNATAAQLNIDVEELYQKEGLKLVEEYGSLYSAFESAAKNGSKVLTDAGLTKKTAKILHDIVKDKITIKSVTIQGIFELTSLTDRGVEDIRETFNKTYDLAEELDSEINVTTLGAPKYRIEVTAEDYKKAEFTLDKIIEFTEDTWAQFDGTVSFSRE